jgi:hypothetical protein
MKLFTTRFHLPIAFLLMSAHLCAQAHGPVLKSKPHSRPAFVSSNFFWTWYENGLTTFTFSLKNQTGHDVKNVNYRVLFFDRQGSQIHFEESSTGEDVIPSGLARRESVTLDMDTGLSTRKISTSQRVEILNFERAP